MFSTPSREFSAGFSSNETKSELSAGSAKVIAIIYERRHGVGEGMASPIRTCMRVRLSGPAAGSGGGGE